MRVLMYHQVVEGRPPNVHAVSAAAFAAQMRWLRESGYRVVHLEAGLAGGPRLREQAVAITFDDGYLDFLTTALPILRENEFVATVFLIAGLMGQIRPWPDGEDDSRPPLLSWEQTRQLSSPEVCFGAHSLTHPDLTSLAPPAAEHEVRESRRLIEREIGRPVTAFSYPFGRENAEVRRLVAAAGYRLACSGPAGYVGPGGRDQFNLKRITVLAADTPAAFAEKVRGSLKRRLAWHTRLVRSRLHHLLTG